MLCLHFLRDIKALAMAAIMENQAGSAQDVSEQDYKKRCSHHESVESDISYYTPEVSHSWLENDGWKMTFLLRLPIFRGYVKFLECNIFCGRFNHMEVAHWIS